MKFFIDKYLWVLSLLLAGLGCVPTAPQTPNPSDGAFEFSDDLDPALANLPYVEDQLLVQSLPGASAETLAELYTEAGADVLEELTELDLTVLEVDKGRLEAAASILASSTLLENVHKNYVFEVTEAPNDPLFAKQPYLSQVSIPGAWEISVGSDEILIAIVDTGVDDDHPDLVEKVIGGWNTYDDNGDYSDENGHGTSVAGLAAASANNGIGIAGVSWESPLLAVRVSGSDGRSTARHLAAGIMWAVGNGARVINVSFAPVQSNSVVRSAAEVAYNRGALVVISSGNSGKHYTASGYGEALFVGALGSSGSIASFSDRGPYVDLVAPGSGIRTTALGDGYKLSSGTSFSAPIVSGVAALAWSVNPELRPVSIRDVLATTADDLGSRGEDDTYGRGIVSAAAAVEAALGIVALKDSTPPTLSVTRPADGSTKTRAFRTSVSATDDGGIADVVLSIDGIPFATDTRYPYTFAVEPKAFSAGQHELSFVATDHAGNASTARAITVTFTAASGVSTGGVDQTRIVLLSPSAGTSVGSSVTIEAFVSDGDGLAAVEWLVDGVSSVVGTISGTSSTVTFLWRTEGLERGSHTITLSVTDASGKRTSANLSLVKR